jgi:hypothetical protein
VSKEGSPVLSDAGGGHALVLGPAGWFQNAANLLPIVDAISDALRAFWPFLSTTLNRVRLTHARRGCQAGSLNG